jgi:hypothetical protein
MVRFAAERLLAYTVRQILLTLMLSEAPNGWRVTGRRQCLLHKDSV